MILLNEVKLLIPIEDEESQLLNKAAKILKINKSDISSLKIYRKSIDCRKKPNLYYVYSLHIKCKGEEKVVKTIKNASIINPKVYEIPQIRGDINHDNLLRPIVIGAGPAGLFAALILARAGLKPIVLERGRDVDSRTKDIETFFKTGILDTESNVQFGEGGAGCFSDGKLNTLVKDKFGRNRFVLETFVEHGACENILYDAKPHIGTDMLCGIIKSIRQEIISLGGDFRFYSKVTDLIISDNRITGIVINEKETLEADRVILAIGHSARDTFYRLRDLDVDMQAKAFACGFRVEHLQEDINKSQYGDDYPDDLPAVAYKLTHNCDNGRGVYSFCMCPGGYVVNSSSEEGRLTVNGMSYNARDSIHANSAIIVSVGERDYDFSNPLSGIEFQRKLEARAFNLASGKIPQQLYGDFKKNIPSTDYGRVEAISESSCQLVNLREIFSDEINQSFIEGMEAFGNKISGFNDDDVLMSGIEARTSSPVRINRDESFSSNILGLYPCGEGAGYAGGIMSAAMDGIKVAEAIIREV